ERLQACIAYADTISLYNLVLPFYTPFDVSSSVPLNPYPISSGRGVNQTNGTVDLNATFNNQTKVSDVLDHFAYSIECLPQAETCDSKPFPDGMGNYSVVDLGYANRAGLSINGTALVSQSATATQGRDAVRAQAYSLFTQYGRFTNATLDQDEITL